MIRIGRTSGGTQHARELLYSRNGDLTAEETAL